MSDESEPLVSYEDVKRAYPDLVSRTWLEKTSADPTNILTAFRPLPHRPAKWLLSNVRAWFLSAPVTQ